MKNTAIIKHEEDRGEWDLYLYDEIAEGYIWEMGWQPKHHEPISGKGFVFEDILYKIAELQKNGWLVVIKAE